MSNTNRRILIACGGLRVVACLSISVLGISGVGLGLWLRRQPTSVAPQNPVGLQTTPQPILTPMATTTGDANLSADVRQQMDEIQSQVIQIRGLQPSQAVQRSLITPDELRQQVIDDFLKNYTTEDAHNDSITLAAFGLLQPNFDLIPFYTNLYSEQIAGYYDQKTKQMYVVQGESFQGPERMTYAHEYTHVLQDQNFDFENGLKYNEDACKNDSERCAGIQALVEGDATFTEQTWLLKYSTALDKQQIQQFYQNYQSPVYDSAPDFMKEDFLFPYQNGMEFVQTLYDQGGWAAVNSAFKNPPVSSEQILHPEKYPSDEPIQVTLPDLGQTLGSDWHKVSNDTLGEWYTYLLLAYGQDSAARVDQATAKEAAKGWGGDAYAVYQRDSDGAIVLVLDDTWDTSKDATEFGNAFKIYGANRWGKPDQSGNTLTWTTNSSVIQFDQQDAQTLWVMAPDTTTLELLRSALK